MDSVNGTEQQTTIRLESSAVAPPPQPPAPPQNEEEQATTMLPRSPIPPVQPPVQQPPAQQPPMQQSPYPPVQQPPMQYEPVQQPPVQQEPVPRPSIPGERDARSDSGAEPSIRADGVPESPVRPPVEPAAVAAPTVAETPVVPEPVVPEAVVPESAVDEPPAEAKPAAETKLVEEPKPAEEPKVAETGRREQARSRRRHAASDPRPTAGGFPAVRPRRLRRTPAIRDLFSHTRISAADLVLPMFVKEGIDEPVAVSSMPGVVQHSVESLRKAAAEATDAGVGGLMLFGIPAEKDALGTQADAEDGVLVRSLQALRSDLGEDTVLMADLCLCEYTDHGHCGPLRPNGEVDNDATLQRYAEIATAQAAAGAHLVAPSGMMDGQVAAIRTGLDEAGFAEVPILAYSAKYASAFYGPFREAAEGAPQFGDRAGYQQDPARSVDEALREVRLDLAEGADAVMVKPALAYLDVLTRIASTVDVPVAAYQVSGEYAMIEAAAAAGMIDRQRAVMETLTAIRRAGADIVLSYWAVEVAGWLG
jgi:porphobilinogen synthase